jgi:hypothetical protein
MGHSRVQDGDCSMNVFSAFIDRTERSEQSAKVVKANQQDTADEWWETENVKRPNRKVRIK